MKDVRSASVRAALSQGRLDARNAAGTHRVMVVRKNGRTEVCKDLCGATIMSEDKAQRLQALLSGYNPKNTYVVEAV